MLYPRGIGSVEGRRGFAPVLPALVSALVLAVGCVPELPDPGASIPIAPDARPSLTVQVSDATGAGAAAWVVLSPGGRDAETDAAGIATFEALAAGTYSILARGADGSGRTTDIAVGEAAVDAAVVIGAASTRIRGRVTRAGTDSPAIEGAAVLLNGVEATTTAVDGSYEVVVEAGVHSVSFTAPAGTSFLPWTAEHVEVVEGQTATVSALLPGRAADGTVYAGSTACAECHPSQFELWRSQGHGAARKSVPTLAANDDGPAASFRSGEIVSLGSVVPGAQVVLGVTPGGAWSVEVRDGSGGTTGPLPVREGYGGESFGLALALDANGTRVTAPIAWASASEGLSASQPAPGWIPAWTEGWFTGGALTLDGSGRPGAAASWDLRCAGCHATGARLAETGPGSWDLEAHPDAGDFERSVGCEACHGPGAEHIGAAVDRSAKIFNPGQLPASRRVDVCARCHQRVGPDVHPFSSEPGQAVDAAGDMPLPWESVLDVGEPEPALFAQVPASRTHRDQVSEFLLSPHRSGPEGYDGACEDCHDPHGSPHPASTRASEANNDLCTDCHATRFPGITAEASHANHDRFLPDTWRPGACVSCHLPRTGLGLRSDGVSGVGEVRGHALVAWSPADVIAEFDAAGTGTLHPADVPVTGCLDCHLQNEALEAETGGTCDCPVGDPTLRSTWVDQQQGFDTWAGGSE